MGENNTLTACGVKTQKYGHIYHSHKHTRFSVIQWSGTEINPDTQMWGRAKNWISSGMFKPLTQLASTNLRNYSPLIGIVGAPKRLYPRFLYLRTSFPMEALRNQAWFISYCYRCGRLHGKVTFCSRLMEYVFEGSAHFIKLLLGHLRSFTYAGHFWFYFLFLWSENKRWKV